MNDPISFFRNKFNWDQTIFILGLPRSGKSSLLRIIGSLKDVVFAEEPLDITLLALKSLNYEKDSHIYQDMQDSYYTLLSHTYSECKLGRNFNFRVKDQSCIFNFKSKNEISAAQSIERRRDLLESLKEPLQSNSFAIVLNDVEFCLSFLLAGIPSPKILFVERDPLDVAYEIAKKGWLSNESLSTQADMTPAYRFTHHLEDKTIHIPYFLDTKNIDLFLSLNEFNRALMYTALQWYNFHESLGFFDKKMIVEYENFISDPASIAKNITEELHLHMGGKTEVNILNLSERKVRDKLIDIKIENDLIKYLASRNIRLRGKYHGLF